MDKEKQSLESHLVKSLGEWMGYGNLMSFASAHWRKLLKDKGLPESGAFIPVTEIMVKEEEMQYAKPSMELYDKIIDN